MMRLRHLPAVVLCGVLTGLVLASGALSDAALAGLMATVASDGSDHLPNSLRTPSNPQASYVYASDGSTLITMFYDQDRHDVALSDMAPVMRRAIVAAEDIRFFQHGAVDPKGVLRALVSDVGSGRAEQGASTLTMQYVRNALKYDPTLTPEQRRQATADTAARKLREMEYATALERTLPKAEILRRYLNVVYFGGGAYGVDAASRTYFSRPPSQLTLAEAALLAGLVRSPDADNPVTGNRAAALGRRAYVLDAMVRAGDITAKQAAAATAEPLRLRVSRPPNDCAAVPATHNDWGFFCDYLRRWWDAQPQFGAAVADRARALRQGGYRIVTSLDPRLQAVAMRQALSVYGYDSARVLPTAVVQPATGRVLAMAVNRHYRLDPGPDNTVNQLVAGGGGVDGYQAGSTFKMFTVLAALSAGYSLDTAFDAPARLRTRWPDRGPGSCQGYWCPENANPSWMDGRRTMWTGFGRSVNTYFVWLEEQVGPRAAVAMAQRLGISFRAARDNAMAASPDSWGAFTLGVADTTPLDLANAYATLAADGRYCAPLPVMSITDRSGRRVGAAEPVCRQAISADLAAAATDAARCPVGQQSAYHRCDGGTARRVSTIVGGRPVAGKTGSSERNATETFVGYAPQVAAAGIAANPDNPRDYVGAGVSARVDTAVARVLAAALTGQPYQDFPVPSWQLAFGSPLDGLSGG